jgi:hypothetical protein
LAFDSSFSALVLDLVKLDVDRFEDAIENQGLLNQKDDFRGVSTTNRTDAEFDSIYDSYLKSR